STPGWQRAQANKGSAQNAGGFAEPVSRYDAGEDDTFSHVSRGAAGTPKRIPLTIEGELVAKSTGTTSAFKTGDRVFHQKFGNGNVTAIDGNKLTILFDRAGE